MGEECASRHRKSCQQRSVSLVTSQNSSLIQDFQHCVVLVVSLAAARAVEQFCISAVKFLSISPGSISTQALKACKTHRMLFAPGWQHAAAARSLCARFDLRLGPRGALLRPGPAPGQCCAGRLRLATYRKSASAGFQ